MILNILWSNDCHFPATLPTVSRRQSKWKGLIFGSLTAKIAKKKELYFLGGNKETLDIAFLNHYNFVFVILNDFKGLLDFFQVCRTRQDTNFFL